MLDKSNIIGIINAHQEEFHGFALSDFHAIRKARLNRSEKQLACWEGME